MNTRGNDTQRNFPFFHMKASQICWNLTLSPSLRRPNAAQKHVFLCLPIYWRCQCGRTSLQLAYGDVLDVKQQLCVTSQLCSCWPENLLQLKTHVGALSLYEVILEYWLAETYIFVPLCLCVCIGVCVYVSVYVCVSGDWLQGKYNMKRTLLWGGSSWTQWNNSKQETLTWLH